MPTEQLINKIVDGVTPSVEATVKNYTNSNPQSVELVDTNGDAIATTDGVPVIIVAPTDFEGSPVTVGTTAVEITFAGTTQAVSISSDVENVGFVYMGKSNVTNAGANAMEKLEPGASVSIDFNDGTNAIYVVSDTADQTIYKLALL